MHPSPNKSGVLKYAVRFFLRKVAEEINSNKPFSRTDWPVVIVSLVIIAIGLTCRSELWRGLLITFGVITIIGFIFSLDYDSSAPKKPKTAHARREGYCFKCGKKLGKYKEVVGIDYIDKSNYMTLHLICKKCNVSFCPQCAGRRDFVNACCPICGSDTTPPLITTSP
jgi:hypothetical protein